MDDLKRAKLIGIDHYGSDQLDLIGCVKDASDLSKMLARHENQEHRNFDCELITSLSGKVVDAECLEDAIDRLFSASATSVLFYFAGHAAIDPATSKGNFIVPKVGGGYSRVPFDYLLNKANDAFSKGILSTVIILDCCGAGGFGEPSSPSSLSMPSTIGKGVTILAASGRTQKAVGSGTGGLFTQYMVEGLRGSAADLRGKVSAASIYAHIDHMIGAEGQRPIYKANVERFIALRQCSAKIDFDVLSNLHKLFPNPEGEFQLDPSFEPNRDNTPKWLEETEPDPKNTETFKNLQALNRHGIVVPVNAKHMYYAAIESKSCRLTELGKHYRALAELGRL